MMLNRQSLISGGFAMVLGSGLANAHDGHGSTGAVFCHDR